jgi:hypothetical protein
MVSEDIFIAGSPEGIGPVAERRVRMESCSVLESDMVCFNYIPQPQEFREWVLRLEELRPGPGARRSTTMFPYLYRFGSCDIFPLWYISAVIEYVKESGDFGILEELRLQSVFNAFCSLSGEFAGIIGLYGECGRLSFADAVTVGLFEGVCREYLGLCRFLEMGREASVANLRLKWVSDLVPALSGLLQKADWSPYAERLVERMGAPRRGRECGIDFRTEIGRFLLSGIFGIMSSLDKEKAYDYWMATSPAWGCKAAVEWIFGIRPGLDGLLVDPRLPDHFGSYKIKRGYRNAVYEISVINPGHCAADIKRLVVDGTEYLGNQLPNFADGKTHRAEVTMGYFQL